jgi:murein DD-endopeptidase MepM/ murein hydrolase activator NlpD
MRRLRPLAALLVVALATLALGAPGAVGQQSDKQQQLQQKVDDASAAESAARAKVVDAQAEQQRLEASLADVNVRLAAANDRLASAQATVDRLAFEALGLQLKLDDTQKKLNAARNDVRHSAVLLYRHGDGAEMLGLLGSTDGAGELVEGKHYLRRVSDKRQADARRVTRLKNQLDAQRDEVAAQKQQADAARAAAAAEKDQLDKLAEQQARATQAAAQAASTAAAARDQAAAVLNQAEAELQAESARIAAIAQSAGGGPSLGDGTFIWPVSGGITSGFGSRTDPITGATAYHSGLDIGAACGTPIKAAGTGVVLTAGWNSGGYGNMTLINHGGGLSTLYGHQSSIIVSAGQSVTQGQVIGYVGSTGKSTGCHLHFEVRVNGNPVDPRAYL